MTPVGPVTTSSRTTNCIAPGLPGIGKAWQEFNQPPASDEPGDEPPDEPGDEPGDQEPEP
jgi:hypothetical protein